MAEGDRARAYRDAHRAPAADRKELQILTARKWRNTINAMLKKQADEPPRRWAAIVDTLSGILEKRDQAEEEFAEDGRLIVTATNKAGAEYTSKNPLVLLIVDLNASALAYWKELGLTPAAYKRMTGDAPAKGPQRSALERALDKLGQDGE